MDRKIDINKKIRLAHSKVIKKRLIDKDMTQKQLALMVGMNPAYMKLIMNGKRSGKTYLNKICKVLDIDNINVKVS